jgi:hypothetical protein
LALTPEKQLQSATLSIATQLDNGNKTTADFFTAAADAAFGRNDDSGGLKRFLDCPFRNDD